jgi:hypothetical protein
MLKFSSLFFYTLRPSLFLAIQYFFKFPGFFHYLIAFIFFSCHPSQHVFHLHLRSLVNSLHMLIYLFCIKKLSFQLLSLFFNIYSLIFEILSLKKHIILRNLDIFRYFLDFIFFLKHRFIVLC